MSKGNNYRYSRKLNPSRVSQPSKIVLSKPEVRGHRRRRDLCRPSPHQGQGAPYEKHDDHDGCDLHDAKRLCTGFVNALDIAPPEIRSDQKSECRRELVRRNRHAGLQHFGYFIDDAAEILSSADGTDGPGKDVIKNESRNRQARKKRSHGIANDHVDASPDVHAAALQINRTHRKAEQHDRKNEPRRTSADRLLGNTTGIKGG